MTSCTFGFGALRRAGVALALVAGAAIAPAALAQAGSDDCASAPLLPLNTLATGNNSTATSTNDGVSCTSAQGTAVSIKNSVWYRFNPATAGTYLISTCGSIASGTTAHDTVLAIFTGGTVCANALTTANILACNDQSNGTNGVACNPPWPTTPPCWSPCPPAGWTT
jgi:hypothetical protein